MVEVQNKVGDMVRWPEDALKVAVGAALDRPKGHRPINQDHIMTIVTVDGDQITRHCNCGHTWTYTPVLLDNQLEESG